MNRFLLTSIVCKFLKPVYNSLNNINSINYYKLNDLLVKRHLLAIDRRYSSLDSSETNVAKDNQNNTQNNAKVNQSVKQSIEISDGCVQRLKKVLESNDEMLRLEVFSGGCSGLSYKFNISKTTAADDLIFEKNGVKVVVDLESLKYINGSTIDYSEELIKSSFRVINNPQSEQGCSCGASFSIKFDNGFKFKT